VATDALARPPLCYARLAGFIYLFAMALGIFSLASMTYRVPMFFYKVPLGLWF